MDCYIRMIVQGMKSSSRKLSCRESLYFKYMRQMNLISSGSAAAIVGLTDHRRVAGFNTQLVKAVENLFGEKYIRERNGCIRLEKNNSYQILDVNLLILLENLRIPGQDFSYRSLLNIVGQYGLGTTQYFIGRCNRSITSTVINDIILQDSFISGPSSFMEKVLRSYHSNIGLQIIDIMQNPNSEEHKILYGTM